MTRLHTPLRLLLATLLLAALSGCANNRDVEETNVSNIPQSRPADWEGQLPGMGGM